MNIEERLNEIERKVNTLAWFIFYNTKKDEHSVCKEVRLSESAYEQVKEMFADALCIAETKTENNDENKS